MKQQYIPQARLSPFALQNRQTQKKPRRVLLRRGVRRAPLCHILNDAAELKIIKGCIGSKGKTKKIRHLLYFLYKNVCVKSQKGVKSAHQKSQKGAINIIHCCK